MAQVSWLHTELHGGAESNDHNDEKMVEHLKEASRQGGGTLVLPTKWCPVAILPTCEPYLLQLWPFESFKHAAVLIMGK